MVIKRKGKYKISFMAVCGALLCSVYGFFAYAQYKTSTLPPPPPVADRAAASRSSQSDSIALRYPVQSTVPSTYDDLSESERSIDLKNPSNITTEAEYDYETGCYVIRTKLGDNEIATPFMLSSD